jgi:LCP family protein required for cell wall assembly
LLTSRVAKLIAGKVGYGAICLVAAVTLATSFYAHKVVADIDATGKGITISGSPSVGAMNILVMGLESRTNYEGEELPADLLAAMHAGTVGGQDTDTLILIHIFAGGQKAVGFSIPRDDLVTYPHATLDGFTEGKIDQAYDYAYNQYIDDNVGKESNSALYLGANQAGQAFEIATVESITGVHIDHFIESNLAGFYYLAQVFGGIEVCITPAPAANGFPSGANMSDSASGWNAVADGYNVHTGGAQYLHLSAPQALAYVRDRDSLPEIDLDRTHRQQAVIDYVVWALKHESYFSDLGKLTSLLGTASQYLITDSTFNLLDFASNMRALSGNHMTFTTLPIVSEPDILLNGTMQDVNTIDVPYIEQEVHNAFYPAPTVKTSAKKPNAKATASAAAPSSITVTVYNGGSTPGLAGDVSQALSGLGYKTGTPADASAQSQTVQTGTQVFYGAGASANAGNIATEFGTTATALSSLPADQIEVLLGSASATVPAGLSASPSASTQSTGATAIGAQTASDTPSPSATNAANDGQTGGAVTVSPNAKYGIPCVY